MQHRTNTQPSVLVPIAGDPMTSTSPSINRWRAFALLALASLNPVLTPAAAAMPNA